MKTKEFIGDAYQSPKLSVMEVMTEGVLCESGDPKWYEKSGQGDFTYGVETDDTWA